MSAGNLHRAEPTRRHVVRETVVIFAALVLALAAVVLPVQGLARALAATAHDQDRPHPVTELKPAPGPAESLAKYATISWGPDLVTAADTRDVDAVG